MANDLPVVSVIVCTRNRVKMLDATLLSLIKQDFESTLFEIVVVDNASQDGTRNLVSSYSGTMRAPSIRYVYEEHLGSSWARNAGWHAAQGKYIAYVDDDEIADQFWLRFLMSGFEGRMTFVSAVGGAVILDWGGKRPDWLPITLEKFYSGVDFGQNSRILTNEEYPLTANLVVLRELVDKLGGFQTALGHVGNLPSGGEDIDLISRIRSSGAEIFYEPKAIVYHHIPKSRQERKWILWRCYAGGLSQPILDPSEPVEVRNIFYSLRLALYYSIQSLFFLLKREDSAFIESNGNGMVKLGKAVRLIEMYIKNKIRQVPAIFVL